ncbi:MAG: ATP phosphoribosyltransferase [Flavobacteriales bacterium]|nr:ATP phosphoribosyltransferase [Flavobacteriales bacterium]
MEKLRIAIQKSGRLSEKSLKLLADCGIRVNNGGKLKADAANFPLEVLFLRDDDISQYVEEGVADVGMLGENTVIEKGKNVEVVRQLGFAKCRLSLAVPKEVNYSGTSWFEGKKVATSYPEILGQYFKQKGVNATIEVISGSVEIAPGIGLAEGICDIVSTGSTLLANGLKEVEQVMTSQAVLIANPNLPSEKRVLLESILFRMNAVQKASENKYILLNAPNDKLKEITEVLPGMKSPTILPLAEEGWSSLHSVVKEDEFWEVIDKLKSLGAEGILVCPIEKMIL